jgi:hypothetical protein
MIERVYLQVTLKNFVKIEAIPRKTSSPILFFIFYLALPTRAGSPQQHMPITMGPFCLTHSVNFPCGRKPEYPEETHDFRQSVNFYSFHMRTGFESHWESSHWDLNLRPQRWKASALTTWPPKPLEPCCSELFPILNNPSDKFLSKNLIIHPFNNYVIWPGSLALMNHDLGLQEQKVCVT